MPDVGSVVRLTVGISIGAARVRWVVGKRFGVSFATPLAQAHIDQLLNAQRSLVRRMEEQPVIPASET